MKYQLTDDFRADHVPFGELLKGSIVYRCEKYDYGCANDDTRRTGRRHQSVTLDPTGDYPYFTVPSDLLTMVPD